MVKTYCRIRKKCRIMLLNSLNSSLLGTQIPLKMVDMYCRKSRLRKKCRKVLLNSLNPSLPGTPSLNLSKTNHAHHKNYHSAKTNSRKFLRSKIAGSVPDFQSFFTKNYLPRAKSRVSLVTKPEVDPNPLTGP